MPIRVFKKKERIEANRKKEVNKRKFNPRTGEETDKPGGKDPRTIYAPKPQIPPERQMRTGGLSPKQKKIAAKAPPPNKITGADFAVLKKEKAKGRGMGLQDESIKPGKVMKANKGKSIDTKAFNKTIGVFPKVSGAPKNLNKAFKKTIGVMPTIDKAFPRLKADPTKPISSVAPKVTDALKKKKLPGRVGTVLGVLSTLVPATYAGLKQYKDYKSAKKRDKAKVKKYSVGGGADTGTAGERRSRLGVLGNKFKRRSRNEDRLTDKDLEYAKAGLAGAARPIGSSVIKAARKFRDNYKAEVRDSAKVKKMGGGMMQRPMGYVSGGKAKSKPASPQRKPEGIKDDTFDPIMKKPEGMKKELAIIQTEDAISRKNIGDGKKMTRRGLMKVVDAAADDRQLGRSLRKFQRDVFKTGGSVMARGCKLGRTKKTKLY